MPKTKGERVLPLAITLAIIGAVVLLVVRQRDTVAPRPVARFESDRLVQAPEGSAPRAVPGGVVQTAAVRAVPGERATPFLRYRDGASQDVRIAGSWDQWSTKPPLERVKGLWQFDVRPLELPWGRYEYKFIVDGEWEPGDNRWLYINPDGWLERPPDAIFSARIEGPSRIDVMFKREIDPAEAVSVRLEPETEVHALRWRRGAGDENLLGFSAAGEFVTFVMDESVYDLALAPDSRVTVAGGFNGWRADAGPDWTLHDADNDNVWKATVRVPGFGGGATADDLQFKFVVDGKRWLAPPAHAANRMPDGRGNVNLRIMPRLSATPVMEIHTTRPLDLSVAYRLLVEGLKEGLVYREVTPGEVLDLARSDKPLGCSIDTAAGQTVFRLFAHRASGVELCLYDTYRFRTPDGAPIEPREVVAMTRDDDGVWEAAIPGTETGLYYGFRVDGPRGAGEGFNAHSPIGDPYAIAMAHAENTSIVLDPNATNRWFRGWTDDGWRPPPLDQAVIYEAHVRDLTWHPSSGVDIRLRGKYAGIPSSRGTGTGLDHLKRMGVNYIEFLPIAEFGNGTNRHDWGYGPAFYFAPEASYGLRPLEGSQYYEFKHLVNELHKEGFGVLLDVVYNHIGSPNVFAPLDRKYYFRQDQDFRFSNFSGCGNDFRTEAPMMRRLIVDNILYWMREHRVDGFRFDLAELIDMETLMLVRDEARALNPDVVLISEPWSFRGDHRAKIRGTGWAAWNGDFRYGVYGFLRGQGNRDDIKALLRGSVDRWAQTPADVINYVESHDDKTFADEITAHPGGDGRHLSEADAARNRIGATLLFTALGVPMIAQGQEWIRSKHGIHNTYDRGDAVNALRWDERRRPAAAVTMRYYAQLIEMRKSPGGATFRWMDEVPADYFRWIEPGERQALGYVVNGERRYPGAAFAVFVNAATRPVAFTAELPDRAWRIIGDGSRIVAGGIPGMALPPMREGVRVFELPALSTGILVGM